MIAWPWYLFSAGIVLIIIGCFWDTLRGLGSGPRFIDPRMSDKKIKRILKKDQGISFGRVLILIGVLLLLVSVGWRLARGLISFFSMAR
jgi:hypothetical protein